MITTKSSLKFRKLGQVVNHDDGFFRGNQCPTPFLLNDDVLRVYYTARGKDNKTYPFFVDLDASDPHRVLATVDKPLFDFGPIGTFDDVGIVPSQVFQAAGKTYMYYQGFNNCSPARYKTAIGIAIDTGDGFKRHGNAPILDRSESDPIAVGTPFLFGTKLYYLSHDRWEMSQISGVYEPFYSIKETTILDYEKVPPSTTDYVIPLESGVGGIARPWVWQENNQTYMLYCRRGSGDYRKNPEQTYKTQCAVQNDSGWLNQPLSIEGPDELMMAYPAIAKTKFGTLLMYNNDFTSGLQIAVME